MRNTLLLPSTKTCSVVPNTARGPSLQQQISNDLSQWSLQEWLGTVHGVPWGQQRHFNLSQWQCQCHLISVRRERDNPTLGLRGQMINSHQGDTLLLNFPYVLWVFRETLSSTIFFQNSKISIDVYLTIHFGGFYFSASVEIASGTAPCHKHTVGTHEWEGRPEEGLELELQLLSPNSPLPGRKGGKDPQYSFCSLIKSDLPTSYQQKCPSSKKVFTCILSDQNWGWLSDSLESWFCCRNWTKGNSIYSFNIEYIWYIRILRK